MPARDPVQLTAPKGLPPDAPDELGRVGDLGWHLFGSDFHLPMAVLIEPVVRRNSATMAAYCERHGFSLSPHGKTTMAPELMRLQLEDGAWAITAATVWQASVMRAAGVPRVLIANQVVTGPEIRWLAEALHDPEFDVYCYVDSLRGVELLEETLADAGPPRPLPVLLELGVPGGRTGARNIADALPVAAAARDAAHLVMAGTAGFEGIIADEDGRTATERVQEFLGELRQLTHEVEAIGGFDEVDEVIVTAGGSAFFDHVVEAFAGIELERPVRRILRSGCYLTHADGGYDLTSPMGRDARINREEGRLEAAMEVWGAVLSRPEPTRAIVGVGKRDVSPDGEPPVVRAVRDRAGNPKDVTATAVALNDQHAYLDVPVDSGLVVGDLVAFGVRHPCTTFDKWRAIPMVDSSYRVERVIRTYF